MPSPIFILVLQYTIPLLLLFFFLFHKHKHTKRNNKNSPPSPKHLPIIGNLHQISKSPHKSLRTLSRKHGDIMLLHLGSKPTLVVSSAESASQVMKTHDLAFCSRPNWSLFTKLMNNGKDVIAAPYGDYWRHMRSICVLELLSNKRVQSFRGVREEEVKLMIHNIRQKVLSSSSNSTLVDMREVFVSLANDLVSRVVLGRKPRRENDNSGVDFEELLGEMAELVGRFSIGDFIPWLAWIDRLSGASARADKVIKTFDGFLESIILEHSNGNGNGHGDATKAFVDILLDIQHGGDIRGHMPIDRDSIKGLLLDMFAAGTDTSSTVLEWMMSEILINPNVMEKLKQEAREVGNGKEAITEDDCKSMVYLKAVIRETLRLHTPTPLLPPRESIQDVKIEGYDIASGTLVFTNAWAIGRDPRYWEDPESFRPERFLNSSTTEFVNLGHDLRMIPFGFGRRGCPGELFAVVSIELAMANLLLHFEWRLPVGQVKEAFDMGESPGITTRRASPLLVVATPV